VSSMYEPPTTRCRSGRGWPGGPLPLIWVLAGPLGRERISRGMPSILREGPYRIYFYSHEPNEPPHVHVDRDDRSAKFWLQPVALSRNLGFGAAELRRIERLVREHATEFLEAWSEYFGT